MFALKKSGSQPLPFACDLTIAASGFTRRAQRVCPQS